jgi:hypothetical protein
MVLIDRPKIWLLKTNRTPGAQVQIVTSIMCSKLHSPCEPVYLVHLMTHLHYAARPTRQSRKQ